MSEIKALEWREDWGGSLDDIPEWRAKTPWGSVTVSVAGYRDENGRPYERHSDVPEELKTRLIAERQSDYEARIRSALVERKAEPVAVPEDATPAMIAAALAVDWSNESEEATAHNVWHAFRSSLSASPSPVDSRDGLIERLEDAVRIYLEALDSDPEKDVLDEDGVSFASDWSHQKHDAEVAAALDDVRAALAAKEQQP